MLVKAIVRQRSKRQPLKSLRWQIYVFNLVVNTKLPVILAKTRTGHVSSYEICPFVIG